MLSTHDCCSRARRIALAALALLGAAHGAARATTWIHEEVVPPGGLEAVAIAADSGGFVHLSGWCPQTLAMSYGFWNGVAWSLEPLEALPASPQSSTIALDAAGRPHVAWAGADPMWPALPALRHAVRDLGVWSVTSVDAGPSAVGRLPSLAIRGAECVIAYEGWPGELRCARWNGSEWTVESVDATGFDESPSQRVSAAVGPDGVIHLAYRSEDPDTTGLHYARRDAAGWSVRSLALGTMGHWVTIAVGSDHRPSLVHTSLGLSTSVLLHSRLEGDSLHTTVVDDTALAGFAACHQLDRWDQPHVAYQEGASGCTRYARRCGDEWRIEPVDETCFPGPLWMSLDANARVHVVYGLGTGALVHAHAAPLANGATHVVLTPGSDGTEFRVSAVDEGGSPVPGAEIVVDFSACPDVVLCRAGLGEGYDFARGRYRVRGFADCFGERWFHVRGGGRSAAPCAVVWVNGVATGSFPVASTDANGDLVVGAFDEGALLDCFGGTDPRCDLNGDGFVSVSDLAILNAVFGTSCPTAVGVGEPPPARFHLAPVAPNPSRGAVTLVFELASRAAVRLDVLDLLGRRVHTLLGGAVLAAGAHRRVWDGRTDAGAIAPPGVYRVRLASGGEVRTAAVVRVP